jgi:hypothetical protein
MSYYPLADDDKDDDKVAVASGLALGDDAARDDKLAADKELFAVRAIMVQWDGFGRFVLVLMISLVVLYYSFLEPSGGSSVFNGIIILVVGLMSLFGFGAYQFLQAVKKINHIYSTSKTRDLQPPGHKGGGLRQRWYVIMFGGGGTRTTQPKKVTVLFFSLF